MILAAINPLLTPSLLEWGLALLILLALCAGLRSRRQWPYWANVCSLALRSIALVCAALLILRPETVLSQRIERKKSLLILTDASQSMLLRSGPKTPSRGEQGGVAMRELVAEANARGWPFSIYDAGEVLTPRNRDDINFSERATHSALGDVLEQASREAPPQTSAVVFLTDGCVNRGRSLAHAAQLWTARGVPIFPVQLGDDVPTTPDVECSELTLKRTPENGPAVTLTRREIHAGERVTLETQARLRPDGPNLNGPLADTVAHLWVQGPIEDVRNGWKEMGGLRHRLIPAPGTIAVRLAFTPPQAGTYRIRLTLDALHDERILSNNVAYTELTVLPEPRRVLFVSSTLGHDFRYLKSMLTEWAGKGDQCADLEIVADFVRPFVDDSPNSNLWPVELALQRWLPDENSVLPRRGVFIWDDPDPRRLSLKTQARLAAALRSGIVGWVGLVRTSPAEWTPRWQDALLSHFSFNTPPNVDANAALHATPLARQHPATRWSFENQGNGAGRDNENASDPFLKLGDAHVVEGWGNVSSERELVRAGARTWLAVSSGVAINEPRMAWWFEAAHWRWLSALPAGLDDGVGERLERADRYAARMQMRELWSHVIEWAEGKAPAGTRKVRLRLPRRQEPLGERIRGRVSLTDSGGITNASKYSIEARIVRVSRDLPPLGLEDAEEVRDETPWEPLQAERITGVGQAARSIDWSGVFPALETGGEWQLCVRVKDPQGMVLDSDAQYVTASGSSVELSASRPDRAALQQIAEQARTIPNSRASDEAALATHRAYLPTNDDMKALTNVLVPYLVPDAEDRESRSPTYNPLVCVLLLFAALSVDIWLRRT